MDQAAEGSRAHGLRRGFSAENLGDAEAAALYARGDADAFAPIAANRSGWADERSRLIEWAKHCGKLEAVVERNPLMAPTRGTEQLVYPQGDRLHKYFYVDKRLEPWRQMEQGMFGQIDGEEVKTRPASPAEAMARIAWFNRLYPQARIDVEGVDANGASIPHNRSSMGECQCLSKTWPARS